MKILCLFVRHGPSKYPESLDVLDRWYEKHGLLGQRTLWIVDNALPGGTVPQALSPNVILRAGDNSAWEFSAWARAMRETTGEESASYDFVHFVTSAFGTLYNRYLEHFHVDMLDYVTARDACLGHIDSYDRPVEFSGQRSASWIRSCFFFLPLTVARKIKPWVAFADAAQIFSRSDASEFREDGPISADYRKRIQGWLEGQEVGGHTWHSPIHSGPEEARRFQQKTLAILNEHSLSVTLRGLQISLVDFCWLHTLQVSSPSLEAPPPPEQEQLKVRRRILGIPEPPAVLH